MSVFFIPALISLLLKLYILIINFKLDKISIVFLSLIIIFALHNGIELFGYLSVFNNGDAGSFFRPYYVITLYLLSYLLLYGLTVSGYINRVITTSLLSLTTLLAGLVLFSDQIIIGYESIGYSVTAIEGKYYPVLSAFVLVNLSLTFGVLFYKYKNADSLLQSQRCLHSIYALTPIIFAFTLTVICKSLGIKFNAAVIVPIATTLFLIILLSNESRHKLSDIRKFLPLSLERQTSKNFMSILDHYITHGNEQDKFKTVQSRIEKEIIIYSLKKCDYNISKTTQLMGLRGRSTLYSMMKRLDINAKSLKAETNSNTSK